MKIYIFTKYTHLGASSRYRTFQYLPSLKQCGHTAVVSPLFDDAYLARKYKSGKAHPLDVVRALFRRLLGVFKVPRQSIVLIEYELLPYCPAVLERWLVWRGCRIVVDYDDAIFHNYDTHRFFWVRALLSRKIATVMRIADRVIVGNEYLAEYAQAAGASHLDILPTVIDLDRYKHSISSGDKPLFTIGWLGSPSTARYLNLIQPALAELCKNSVIRIRLIGSEPINLDGVPAEFIPWTESGEVNDICALDVGIMPLPDEPWAKGKCGFKLIQYMACGIPVVASPVGVNSKIVCHGQEGYLADTNDEWIDALRQLASSPQLRGRMGLAGRHKVEAHYCLQVTALRWIELIESLTT